jgi:outer membrane protein assembly factor BamB
VGTPFAFHSQRSLFAGFPPVLYNRGFLVGDDTGHRFLTPLAMAAGAPDERHWHLDVQQALGIPAADGQKLYISLGGPGASRAVMALDGATGAPLWRYARTGCRRTRCAEFRRARPP